MVSELKIDAIKAAIPQDNQKVVTISDLTDESIFETSNEKGISGVKELSLMLDEVEAEQGLISKGWNEIKEFFNAGTSVEKCEEAIERYKQGLISFEEAAEEIAKFDTKQDSSLELFSNILTGIAAIGAVAATVATGGAAGIAIGAAAGAATKAGTKLFDRATNKVEGDAMDGKQITKDLISGGITGAIGVATAGTGGGAFLKAGKNASFGKHVLSGAKASAKTGLITGSISGSSGYLLDCAYDDKEFKFGEFVTTTATSAAVSGTVGTLLGGTNGALRHTHLLKVSNENAVYKVTNDRIRAIAS